MLFYIPYPIPYPGVKFGIGYPYPVDSSEPDMDCLKRIRRWIRYGNYPIRLHPSYHGSLSDAGAKDVSFTMEHTSTCLLAGTGWNGWLC